MQIRKEAVIYKDKKFLGEIEETLLKGGYVPIPVNNALLAVHTVVKSKPAAVDVKPVSNNRVTSSR